MITLEEPGWAEKIRKNALKLYNELELPRLKYGLSLNLALDDLELGRVDFDGKDDLEIKGRDEAIVLPLEEALKTHSKKLKGYFMEKAYYPREDKLSAMHAALWNQGVFVYVPEGVDAGTVRIKQVMKSSGSASHIVIIAEENSKVHVVHDMESKGVDYGVKSDGVEAFLSKNAKVTFEACQDLGENIFHFAKKRAIISENANIDWFTATVGAKLSRVEVSTDLAGKGADTNNKGLFIGRRKQRFDIYNTAVHTSPQTHSDMESKGIVLDNSKSIYRGLIKIGEGASDSRGYQKQDTLVLSPTAEADAVPNLEIENNDVMCSHGATIGQIDKEELFYLMSRGLSEEKARRQIVKGFLSSMVDKVKDKSLRKKMEKMIEARA